MCSMISFAFVVFVIKIIPNAYALGIFAFSLLPLHFLVFKLSKAIYLLNFCIQFRKHLLTHKIIFYIIIIYIININRS